MGLQCSVAPVLLSAYFKPTVKPLLHAYLISLRPELKAWLFESYTGGIRELFDPIGGIAPVYLCNSRAIVPGISGAFPRRVVAKMPVPGRWLIA